MDETGIVVKTIDGKSYYYDGTIFCSDSRKAIAVDKDTANRLIKVGIEGRIEWKRTMSTGNTL